MKPVFWPLIVFAAVITLGCGILPKEEAPTPRATPDTAHFTASQAAAVISEHQYVSFGEARAARCKPDAIRYEGRGIWNCGRWSLDEATGAIFRTPE